MLLTVFDSLLLECADSVSTCLGGCLVSFTTTGSIPIPEIYFYDPIQTNILSCHPLK